MFLVSPGSLPSSHFVPIHAQDGSCSPLQPLSFPIDMRILECFLASVTKAKQIPQKPSSPLVAKSLNARIPPPVKPKSKEELEILKYQYFYLCEDGKDIEGVLTPDEAYLAKALIEDDYEPDFVKEDLM